MLSLIITAVVGPQPIVVLYRFFIVQMHIAKKVMRTEIHPTPCSPGCVHMGYILSEWKCLALIHEKGPYGLAGSLLVSHFTPSLCTLLLSHIFLVHIYPWSKERRENLQDFSSLWRLGVFFFTEVKWAGLRTLEGKWAWSINNKGTLACHSFLVLFSCRMCSHQKGVEMCFRVLLEADIYFLESGEVPKETRNCFSPGDIWRQNCSDYQSKLESFGSVLRMKGIGACTQPISYGKEINEGWLH